MNEDWKAGYRATGEQRKLTMTEEQAAEWWAAASYPVQCSARIKEVEDEHS